MSILNLGLGCMHVYYCSTRSQRYLNVLNANANCPLPPEVRVESVARLPNWYVASGNDSRSQSHQPSAFTSTPHVVGQLVISLSGEDLSGFVSELNLFLFLSPWDFHSLVGCVPILVGAFTGQVP